jgi:formate dehydrogenase subunit gamma
MNLRAQSIEDVPRPSQEESEQILRFKNSERHLHWALAIPFVVCYLTALVLVFVYNPHPARPYRFVFSWMHRISGVSLAVLPTLVILAHWRDFRLHLSNIRRAWLWSWADVKWLLLVGPATLSKRVKQPDQGKFNAGEKINFMAQMATYPVYIVTGLLIWVSAVPYLPWLVHFYTAVFVATPLVLGHIFMATVNPDTRVGLSGMITGLVDRHWAQHHYRHWYDEFYGAPEEADEPAAQVEHHRAVVVPFRAPAASPGRPAFLRPLGSDAATEARGRTRDQQEHPFGAAPASVERRETARPSTRPEGPVPVTPDRAERSTRPPVVPRAPWPGDEDELQNEPFGSPDGRAQVEHPERPREDARSDPGRSASSVVPDRRHSGSQTAE